MTVTDVTQRGDGQVEPTAPTPLLAPPKKRSITERLSLGHVVMITAALLAFVLVVAVLQDRSATTTIAVAGQEILPGSTITADMVDEIEVPADSPLIGKVATLDSISAGLVTTGQRIAPGEPITMTALAPVSAPSGLRAMSVPIDREFAVGGDLTAGDRIDVIAVDDGTATYIATNLEVLATQRASSRSGALSSTSLGGYFVVLAVDDQTALRIALAVDDGSVSILRSTGAQAVADDQRSLSQEADRELVPLTPDAEAGSDG